MKNLNFSALIQFQKSSLKTIVDALDGVAVINTLGLDGETYTADTTFPEDNLSTFMTVVIGNGGKLERMVQTTEEVNFASKAIAAAAREGSAVKSVGKYLAVARKKRRLIKKPSPRPGTGPRTGTKVEKLRKALSTGKWMSMKELTKASGYNDGTIQARFTSFRKAKILDSKVGGDGYKVFKFKKAA